MNINNEQRAKPPLLNGTTISAKRDELKAYFKQTWAEYESLFSLINDDSAYYLRPEHLRHPLIFYFGHTATFYINKLILGKFITDRVDDKLEAICAVGVDEMSWDDLNSENYNWPSVDEVRTYREKVADQIENLIDHMPLSLPITQDSLAWIILMGCEHERIHLETSSVIMRMLPLHYLTVAEPWTTCCSIGEAPVNELMPIKGKLIKFGKPTSDDTFGWDNEFGAEQIEIDDFHTSKYVVSNQEFLAFIDAGGYQKPHLWTKEGQEWLNYTKVTMPRFWFKKVNQNNEKMYWQRNLLNEIPLPLNWPVEVNYLEAKAFCHWKNSQRAGIDKQFIRLPTEAEWLCLRDNIEGDLTSWQTPAGNINNKGYASSCPVNKFEHNGLFDIVGNVWQWTESSIDGFKGFDVHPLYDDFSTPTFDGKHNLIKGGSWISSGNEATKHSRYAFRRHFFQHAGFRYVQSSNEKLPNLTANYYEVDTAICQQLHAQYGVEKSTIPITVEHYSKQITDTLIDCIGKYKIETNHCLDLGCGVGRTSFVLAQHFKQVDAVDFSARYLRHGVNLQNGKSVRYVLENEGDIVDYFEFNLKAITLPCSQNILFSQGDASNLKTDYKGYDVILAQHVLENTYDPHAFLKDVHLRLNPTGLLFVISSYDFDERKTNKENWLGGLKINGENVTGFEGLSLALIPNFTLLKQQQLTKPIKINRRNIALSFPHLSVWQLK
jgi:5-histidylcysteine sulfoxide synthase/putative 4-mercaptohistidine N1-methyltranferase